MRSPYWRESSSPCTISTRRGGDHLGTASSVVTPPTSSSSTPKRKKLNTSNKYDYTKWNDYSKSDDKKKYHFRDKKKKKKFQKMMS
jgi:hypothetical protein